MKVRHRATISINFVYKGVAIIGNGEYPSGQEGHFNMAYTLRYDLTTSSDIKIQLDNQRDQSGPN